jgi:fibronectin type 3 domain-containing protein
MPVTGQTGFAEMKIFDEGSLPGSGLLARFAEFTLTRSAVYSQVTEVDRGMVTVRSPKTASAAPAKPAHTVKLTWKANSSLVIGYNIYRSSSPDNFAEPKLNPAPIPDTIFIDTTVESHKTYYYATKAADARGNESSESNIVKVDVP